MLPYLPRHLAATLRRAMATFPVVMVTGPRQSGKTTLLRQELRDTHRLVSLERPDVRERARSDPVAFLAEHPPPAILDEIQLLPELLHWVKEHIDAERRPGSWILTGSQSLSLMKGVGQTLAGRVAVLDLSPLSVAETAACPPPPSIDDVIASVFSKEPGPAVSSPPSAPGLPDWLLRGGFPEPRLDPRVDRELWFSSYTQTYLERDVRDLLGVGDLATFHRFLALVASRTAQTLNMAELGGEIGVSGPTVKSWLSVLEASHIIYLLPPYYRNFGKRLRKAPKIYLADPGLAAFLVGLNDSEALLKGPSLGALTETAVVLEWVKAFRSQGITPSLYFWRSAGIEIDLLIERNAVLYALEVKATATPTAHHADALARFAALTGDLGGTALACRIDAPCSIGRGIRAVPWHLAW